MSVISGRKQPIEKPLKSDLLRPGENCWQLCEAERAAFIIDGADYFKNVYFNLQKAQKFIFIMGWDIDSRISLLREDIPGMAPTRLDHFLSHLLQKNPNLHIYLLPWNFSPIYAFDREMFQSLKFRWTSDRRLHFNFDDQHPLTGSHHQKIIVIDDQLAYCGGIDLTNSRWDTPQHLAVDPRRCLLNGKLYPPHHDVQLLMEGEPARYLGVLCRQRWFMATGERLQLETPKTKPNFVVPEPKIEQAKLGISRTFPAFKDNPEVREIERLYVDAIKKAKKFIYLENQYFTANAISHALAQSLQQKDGPQIMTVIPIDQVGFLAKIAMRNLSLNIAKKLKEVDRYNRFHIYSPIDKDLPNKWFRNIHSKVAIFDFEYVRVGSANLNNRSMGLDTECDILIDVKGQDEGIAKTKLFFARLLSEHTGWNTNFILEKLENGDLIRSIDAEDRKSKKIYLLPHIQEEPGLVADIVQKIDLFDLEKATTPERILDHLFFTVIKKRQTFLRDIPIGLIATLVFSFALAFVTSSPWVNYWLDPALIATVKNFPDPLLLVFITLALVFFVPLNAMLILFANYLAFDKAAAAAFLTAIMAAVVGYGLGLMIPKTLLTRLFKNSMHLMKHQLSRHRFFDVFLLRFFPLMPFAILNLGAGSHRMPFVQYLAGTALGMTPGILAIVLLQRALVYLLRAPTIPHILGFAVILTLISFSYYFLTKRFINSPKDRYEANVQVSQL